MNLYHISQNINNSYDTYDSAIVAAATEEEARKIHPSGDNNDWDGPYGHVWCTYTSDVTVKLIGTAAPSVTKGVVLASFNAG